jgi:hypothetical protein
LGKILKQGHSEGIYAELFGSFHTHGDSEESIHRMIEKDP